MGFDGVVGVCCVVCWCCVVWCIVLCVWICFVEGFDVVGCGCVMGVLIVIGGRVDCCVFVLFEMDVIVIKFVIVDVFLLEMFVNFLLMKLNVMIVCSDFGVIICFIIKCFIFLFVFYVMSDEVVGIGCKIVG